MSDERYQRLAHEAYTASGGDLKKAEAALLVSVRADHDMLVALTDTFLKNAVASTLYRLAARIRENERRNASGLAPVASTSAPAKPRATPRGPDHIVAAGGQDMRDFMKADEAGDTLSAKASLMRQMKKSGCEAHEIADRLKRYDASRKQSVLVSRKRVRRSPPATA